jgi:hypothetical protein
VQRLDPPESDRRRRRNGWVGHRSRLPDQGCVFFSALTCIARRGRRPLLCQAAIRSARCRGNSGRTGSNRRTGCSSALAPALRHPAVLSLGIVRPDRRRLVTAVRRTPADSTARSGPSGESITIVAGGRSAPVQSTFVRHYSAGCAHETAELLAARVAAGKRRGRG